jgi:3-deoxy-D-manno-octulosonic-acid transferase
MLRHLYTLLVLLALPFLPLRLWWRGRREPGYRRHIAERFGFYQRTRPDPRPLIWIHAVSLGETRAAVPQAEALLRRLPGHRLLLTHMTATGREAGETLFPQAIVAFLPYDAPFAMRRFLRHYRPRLGVVMETEVWPNLLAACHEQAIPVALVNARLSARSARRYTKVRSLAREAFGRFAFVAAQTPADAARLQSLGAQAVSVSGNLKFDMPVPEGSAELAARLRAGFGQRPVLLAASTREGEESLILDALERAPLPADTLVVIVPRHPQRFDTVARLIEERGERLVRRSVTLEVPAEVRYVLGDSLGEMAAWYRACDVAFVGGSLLPLGGQNLIEACAAGVPVLMGPSCFNFAQACDDAAAAGALWRVGNADELIEAATQLFADEAARRKMGAAGAAFSAAHQGAAMRVAMQIAALTGRPGR